MTDAPIAIIQEFSPPDEPHSRFEAALDSFTGLAGSNWSDSERGERAVVLLETAALVGSAGWERLVVENLLEEIEASLSEPARMLSGFEQELFAPAETGLRDRALVLIEALGRRDRSVARDAERLLHAAGEPRAAYRVEGGRRTAPAATRPAATRNAVAGLIVVVAGGHSRLRKMVRRDLARSGIADVREIPAAFEASRVGRDIAAKLGGADLAVLIVRQIAHSTSTQVTVAAEKLGVPVAFSRSAGIAGVRTEIEAFAAAREGVR